MPSATSSTSSSNDLPPSSPPPPPPDRVEIIEVNNKLVSFWSLVRLAFECRPKISGGCSNGRDVIYSTILSIVPSGGAQYIFAASSVEKVYPSDSIFSV